MQVSVSWIAERAGGIAPTRPKEFCRQTLNFGLLHRQISEKPKKTSELARIDHMIFPPVAGLDRSKRTRGDSNWLWRSDLHNQE